MANSPRSRRSFWIGAFVCVLLTFCVLAWSLSHYHPQLLSRLIESQLQILGAENISFDSPRLNLSSLRIENLRLEHPSTERRLGLEIKKISIHFSPRELISYRVQSIHLENAALRVLSNTSLEAEVSTETYKLPKLSSLFRTLPFSRLTLKDSSLELQNEKEFQTISFSGTLDSSRSDLIAKLHFRDKDGIEFSLKANLDSSKRLELNLKQIAVEDSFLSLQIKSTLSEDSTLQLNNRVRAEIDALWHYFSKWVNLPPLPEQMRGIIEGDVALMIPTTGISSDNPLNAQFLLNTSFPQIGGTLSSKMLWKLQGDFKFDIKEISSQFRASHRSKAIALAAKLSQRLEERSGSLSLRSEALKFSENGLRLVDFYPQVPKQLAFTSGEVEIAADISWAASKALASWAELQLKDIDAKYADITFSKIQGSMRFDDLTKPRMAKTARLKSKEINLGIPLTNASLVFRLVNDSNSASSQLKIKNFKANAFGGQIIVTEDTINIETETPSTLKVALRGVDLEEILSLYPTKGLSATGVIDGSLPIHLSGTAVSIKNGRVSARPPGGTIRYQGQGNKQMAASSEYLNILLAALENYHYNLLESGVEYDPNGELRLALSLKGNNPKFRGGQAIHFNINLSENVPALLRSLRLTSEVAGQVEKGFQRKQAH